MQIMQCDSKEETNQPSKQKAPMSPNSPTTPTTPHQFRTIANREIQIQCVLKQIGFRDGKKLADTLQGMIWRAEKVNKYGVTETVVIKITNINLHQHSTAIVKDKLYKVQEDILMEQSILKYLTQDKNCPNSIINFHGFFKTDTDYWLVMEDGGSSLFEFVRKAHELIKVGCIDICEWQDFVKIIFKQMIECIEYIHSKNVVHFDISLENFLVNDVGIAVSTEKKKITKVRFVRDDIHIKLVDFGLAQIFTKAHCLSSKFCGKQQYKSPEICQKKKRFDAKKSDVWCLGLCLFALLTGGFPWEMAHESDALFVFAMKQPIVQLLEYFNVQHYVTRNLVWLLDAMLQFENNRITLNEIKKYFYQYV